MPVFEPFRAIRYVDQDLSAVLAPPYDVLSDADVDRYAARSDHNVVQLDVPRGGADRYQRAADRMWDWLAAGVLRVDDQPSFTIYRLRFTDESGTRRDISGVLGGLQVTDEGSGGVLPHERTTPKASTDRLDLTRATGANLSPVWGLSLASGLTALLAEPGEELGSMIEDGVEHRVERVSDPGRIAAIRDLLATDDVLIADGHHRYGISRTYRDEVRAASGRYDSAAEQTLAFVNELVADQLSVAPIHRLYTDVSADELREALGGRFTLEPTDRPDPATGGDLVETGSLLLVEPATTWRLRPRPGAFTGVRELDGAWLETALADRAVTVTYQHGVAEAIAEVDAGRAVAAVLIRPVSVAEIERTAREGLLMPPKSTFFTPKLKTGFVLRPLD